MEEASPSPLDYDASASITPLQDSQEVALSVLSIIAGFLSIAGSSTIVYKVTKNYKKAAPYDRLLLGLSICDIVASLTYAIGPFLLPAETSQRVWAFGNDATTTALGFLTQFSFSAIVYNGLLSYYYLLTVKYGVKRNEFAKKYELYMHIGTWAFFLTTAALGAIVGFYNELEIGQGAWVVNWPEGCEATDTCKSQFIGLVFGGIPTVITFLSVIVNNILIYVHVRKHLGDDAPGNHIHDNEPSTISLTSAPIRQQPQLGNGDMLIFDWTEKPLADSGRNATPNKSSSFRSLGSVHSAAPSSTAGASRRSPKHASQIREVALQGLLYVASFAMAYTVAFTLRVLEGLDYTAKDEGHIYWLLVLDAFLRPLQGFFNIFVYCRSNYVRFRANSPELGRLWAVRKACLDPNIPRLPRGGSSSSFFTDGAFARTPGHGYRGGSGNHKLTDGVRLSHKSVSRSRSVRGSEYSSNLAALQEESCEDDDPSETDSEIVNEEEYKQHSWRTAPDEQKTEIMQGRNEQLRIEESSLPLTPPARAISMQLGSPPQSGETRTNDYEDDVEDQSGNLTLDDDAKMLEELRKLYQGGSPSQPMMERLSIDCSVERSRGHPAMEKHLSLNGSVPLLSPAIQPMATRRVSMDGSVQRSQSFTRQSAP